MASRTKKPRTLNSLMKYMREEKYMNIAGSTQKKQLLNMGYFHGYKGYRFVQKIEDGIPFTDFNEIIAINHFDNNVKALFYKYLMFLEKSLCRNLCQVSL